jgi:antitoxin (DNA-binding transcriptional repressor) of toxin-antitoxin stability system
MESLSFSEVRTHLAQALQQVEISGQPIAITKHGKPCAILEPFNHQQNGFVKSVEQWRAKHALEMDEQDFTPQRARDAGREFSW